MPAPISSQRGGALEDVDLKASLGECDCRRSGRQCRRRRPRRACRARRHRIVEAARRSRLRRAETRIEPIDGRAVGADRLVLVAHVDEDVRVIERRQRADAHELAHADGDRRRRPSSLWKCGTMRSAMASLALRRPDAKLARTITTPLAGRTERAGALLPQPTSCSVRGSFAMTAVSLRADTSIPTASRSPSSTRATDRRRSSSTASAPTMRELGPTSWLRDLLGARRRRVIAFDNRGHGESGKPHDPEAYRHRPFMAEDARRLLDHLGIARADVIGYSMGARIAASSGARTSASACGAPCSAGWGRGW